MPPFRRLKYEITPLFFQLRIPAYQRSSYMARPVRPYGHTTRRILTGCIASLRNANASHCSVAQPAVPSRPLPPPLLCLSPRVRSCPLGRLQFGHTKALSRYSQAEVMPSRIICTTTCVLISLCSRATGFLLSSPSPVFQRSSSPPSSVRWCPAAGSPRRSVMLHTATVYFMNL